MCIVCFNNYRLNITNFKSWCLLWPRDGDWPVCCLVAEVTIRFPGHTHHLQAYLTSSCRVIWRHTRKVAPWVVWKLKDRKHGLEGAQVVGMEHSPCMRHRVRLPIHWLDAVAQPLIPGFGKGAGEEQEIQGYLGYMKLSKKLRYLKTD